MLSNSKFLNRPFTSSKFLFFCSIILFFTGCSGSGGDSSEPEGSSPPTPSMSPTASISANPNTITEGQTSLISWSSTNTNNCDGTGFEASGTTSGSVSVQPAATTEYKITCMGNTGSAVSTITVTVSETNKTYYVANSPEGINSNVGTEIAPWRDIQFGIDQLVAGDTLIVKAGEYEEVVIFSGNEDSGTENSLVSVIAQNNVIINGANLSPSNRQGLITFHDASYINLENFELKNFRTAQGVEINDTPIGILVDGRSHDLRIKNNHIHHIENLSSCNQSSGCGPGANGIAVYGDTTSAIINLVLENNEVHHCILSSSEAFTINGNVDGFRVLNNFVHDNNNIGMVFIGYESDTCITCNEQQNRARNGIVKGNRAINNSTKLALGIFSNNPWYGNDDGSAGGFYVDGGRNIIFDGNYSSQNDLGFEFASEHPEKSSEDILMTNNFVYLNREVGLTMGGYAESPNGEGGGNAKNIRIFNNSFYRNKGWGTEVSFSFRIIDTVLINNIFVGSGDVNDNFSQESNGQTQNIEWNNNIWWASNTSDSSSIPGNFILTDPLFQSPEQGDLNLTANSPAINAGQLQTDITDWVDSFWQVEYPTGMIPVHGSTDINGDARINSTLDLGADEFY